MKKFGGGVWLLKVGIFLIGLLTALILGAWVTSESRGFHTWEQYKINWAAKGEDLDWRAVVPPVVADHENFLKHPIFDDLEALTEGISLKNMANYNANQSIRGYGWRAAQPVALASFFVKQEATYQDLTEDEASERLSQYLEAQASWIDGLTEASHRPYFRLDFDYETQGLEALLEGTDKLTVIQFAFSTLEARALNSLHRGQLDAAVNDAHTICLLAKHADQGFGVLSGLISFIGWEHALQVVWQGLKGNRWSNTQLASLDTILSQNNLQAAALQHLREERALIICLVENNLIQTSAEELGAALRKLPDELAYHNLINYCDLMHDYALAPNGISATSLDYQQMRGMVRAVSQQRFLSARLSIPNPRGLLTAIAMPNFDRTSARALQIEAFLRLSRLAIANERHRQTHGQFASDLDALELEPSVMSFLTNTTVRYQLKKDNTPLLYFDGLDQSDDGGRPKNSPEHGDWAWQYEYAEFDEEVYKSR